MNDRWTIKKILRKQAILLILILSAFICSIYTLITTPFVFFKCLGLPLMALNAQVLWTLFDKMFMITFDVEIQGEEEFKKIGNGESLIVISNHLGAIDFCIINILSKRKKMLSRAKYMIKDIMKYVPIFGYIQFLGFIMMKRNYAKDKKNIISWIEYYVKHQTPLWFVIYPEGTRFTPAKLKESEKFCESRGLKPNKYVLYPRPRGFQTTIEAMKDSHIRKVLDVTVVYTSYDSKNNTMPSLFDLMFKFPSGKFIIDVKVYNISSIDDPKAFLISSFERKDNIIYSLRTRIDKNQ